MLLSTSLFAPTLTTNKAVDKDSYSVKWKANLRFAKVLDSIRTGHAVFPIVICAINHAEPATFVAKGLAPETAHIREETIFRVASVDTLHVTVHRLT